MSKRNRHGGRDASGKASNQQAKRADEAKAPSPPSPPPKAVAVEETGAQLAMGGEEHSVSEEAVIEQMLIDPGALGEPAVVPVDPDRVAKVASDISSDLAPVVERLKSGHCVLCVGSGFESAVGLPTFRQLLNQLLDSVGDGAEVAEARRVLEHRPFIAAGYVRRRLGERLPKLLRDACQTPAELPSTVSVLGELPFRAIITTSYSDLFQRAFAREGKTPPVYTPFDIEGLRRDSRNRYVLMVLGDPARQETVLFTAQEIQDALSNEAYRGVIHNIYRNRSILFLGFTSADIELLFGRLFAGAPRSSSHYAVLPGLSPIEAEELDSTFHIHTIDQADLPGLVKQLRDAIGDFDPHAPPDDDDLEGWLDVLANEPTRTDALHKLFALADKLRKQEDYERLMELHLGLAEYESTAAGRAGHLREVARILEEHVGDRERAFTAFIAAYKECPSAGAADEMERISGVMGRWTELLHELAAMASGLAPEARALHYLRMAHLYHERLEHDEYALDALKEALALDGGMFEALDLRLKLLRKAESWKALAETLKTRIERESEAGKQRQLYLEHGEICESRLGDTASAVQAYRKALELDAGNHDALEALELLYRRHEDYRPLLDILDQKIETAMGDDKRALRKEAAAIAAEKLKEHRAAIERYEALRNDDDRDLDVLLPLESLYQAEGRIDDYFEVLAARAEAVRSDGERLALYRRLGSEWEQRPGGATRAAEVYEKLLTLDARAEDALCAVERLYASEKKWEALVDAYRRHMELPGAQRVTLGSYIGQVLENEIKDVTRATAAWEQVLELQSDHDEALAALARLHRQAENWHTAIEFLDKRGGLTKDVEQKVALIHESAKIACEKLGDAKQAETRFARVLSLDPTHVPSMLALVELYRSSGEFLRAAKLLVEAHEHTHNRLDKAHLLVQAGELYVRLDDNKQAADLYLKALAVDPEHIEAATRVSDLLWRAERWAELVAVLEMLTRKDADRETQRQRWSRLGRAAREVGQLDKAQRAFTKAAEIDPTDLEAQRARAEILFNQEKWLESHEAHAAVLHYHRDSLLALELVDLFYHLGECDRHLGHIDKAKNFYAKAIEIDPTHRPTILAQIDVGSDDPMRLIEAKKALLATASRDEKVQLLNQIGDLYLDKIESPPEAMGAFREALALKPEARMLLHKCLEVYVEQKDWRNALEMLERLTGVEQVPSVRAKLRFTRAMIYRDELHDDIAAIQELNQVLEDDEAQTTAAPILEQLLERTGRWKDLERFYRKAIKRLGPELDSDTIEARKERLRMWSHLAEICLDKLGERMAGLAALEVASTLDRSNIERHEQLARLYVEAGPDMLDKAIGAHQSLLRMQHDRVASYQELRRLYDESHQSEKALAVAYALTLLKRAEPDDVARVAEAKQRALQPVLRNLDDEMWLRNVTHPDEDRCLDGLFLHLAPFVAAAAARSHRELGLNRKDKLEATDPRSFAKALRYVCSALDAKIAHECYVKYEQRQAVTVLNGSDKQLPLACLILGQPLLGERRPDRELLYEMAKVVSHLRPERYLRLVLPQPILLAQVINAAIAVGAETETGKPVAGEIGRKAQELKRSLPPKVLEQVVFFGRKLKGQKGDALASSWLAASELTATRAAYLLIGDLEQTAQIVATEPPTVSIHPTLHRLKELIWFSVSEECFAARRHLGWLP